MGSVRGDAHHTMASSMSTSSYGIWCMHRLFTFAFECRGVAAAYHYVSGGCRGVPAFRVTSTMVLSLRGEQIVVAPFFSTVVLNNVDTMQPAQALEQTFRIA